MIAKNVHIEDENGTRVYGRLLDNGSEILYFQSGDGFVERRLIERNGWTIVDGS